VLKIKKAFIDKLLEAHGALLEINRCARLWPADIVRWPLV